MRQIDTYDDDLITFGAGVLAIDQSPNGVALHEPLDKAIRHGEAFSLPSVQARERAIGATKTLLASTS